MIGKTSRAASEAISDAPLVMPTGFPAHRCWSIFNGPLISWSAVRHANVTSKQDEIPAAELDLIDASKLVMQRPQPGEQELSET
jgi:hypothetical protein